MTQNVYCSLSTWAFEHLGDNILVIEVEVQKGAAGDEKNEIKEATTYSKPSLIELYYFLSLYLYYIYLSSCHFCSFLFRLGAFQTWV